MKFGLAVAGLMTTLIFMPIEAATLKLLPEINVLLIDGKKVSNTTLLKGSNGLELVNGDHQILFKVEAIIKTGSRDERYYESSPLIVTFNTAKAKVINFKLPKINNEISSQSFDYEHNYEMVDEQGKVINSKKDVLNVQGLLITADLEREVFDYNRSGKVASLPALSKTNYTNVAILPETTGLDGISKTVITVKGENVPEQMLQYWYQQADKETQQRFMKWIKSQEPSQP